MERNARPRIAGHDEDPREISGWGGESCLAAWCVGGPLMLARMVGLVPVQNGANVQGNHGENGNNNGNNINGKFEAWEMRMGLR